MVAKIVAGAHECVSHSPRTDTLNVAVCDPAPTRAQNRRPVSPAALFVTTVPVTLKAFLLPFSDYFRAHGWRVDGMANGATREPAIASHFDTLYDVAWSRSPLNPRNLLGTARNVRETVVRGRYDVVHVHTPIAAFVTRYALRTLPAASRPTVIYTAHGFHFYEGQSMLPHALYRTMERAAARWTDHLVTINAQDHAAALALGTIDAERVHLIPGIGVDTTRFDPALANAATSASIREQLDIAPGAFMLTMVAELAPVKRHGFALRALAQSTRDDVVLVLVGDGPLRGRLEAQVRELGVAAHVRFAGYREDIDAVWAASDAGLLVSEREGLARSVLEAMASGKPVIGTRTRGIADAIGEDAGWLVPKHDVAALAHAIDEAASDRTECARRGALARERALSNFALPAIIARYEELYRDALA